MLRSLTLRRSFLCAAFATVAGVLVTACSAPNPEPRAMTPPALLPLPEPLVEELLAVVDCEDQRPESDQLDAVLHDNFLSDVLPPSYFWYFRPSSSGSGTEQDGEARATGEAAFLWHPFPYAGVGSAASAPADRGVADYLAIALQNRGLAPRVIRVGSVEEGRLRGAGYVLESTLGALGCRFVEVNPIDDARPDDVREFRLAPAVAIELRLHRLLDDHLLWEERFDLGEPDAADLLLDRTAHHRGTGYRPWLRLDPERMHERAFADMVAQVERRLAAVTRASVDGVESALRTRYPID